MKKIGYITAIVSVLLIISGIFLFSQNTKQSSLSFSQDSYLYFWGNGCPHCKNVASFLDTWDKKDSIKLEKLEIWYNRENARLMKEKSGVCNINENEMGVPLLLTPAGKCLVGDTQIIEFFKSIQ